MYPVCLDISEKPCVVVGGGSVASRKVKGLLAGDGVVTVISPEISDELYMLFQKKSITWRKRPFEGGDLQGATLVFAATDRQDVQKAIQAEAEKRGILVNVVDDPEACSFQVPAAIRSGDLLLTVSTHGKSPAVSAMIRRQLESEYGMEYQALLDLMSQIREVILAGEYTQEEKKNLFKNILHDDIVHWIKSSQWDLLEKHLQGELGAHYPFDFSSLGQTNS